ncbi:MAG: ATP-binding protein [Methanomicrobiales archaeon]|nr:ATP-binding protein [Methanomicrobiales archaeon]
MTENDTTQSRETERNEREHTSRFRLALAPGKILIIGTMGSGKTTLAGRLARDTGFLSESIDACRIRYGDGTTAGEELAWDQFLKACRSQESVILEFSGCGPHVEEVRDNLRSSGMRVSILWLAIPLESCIARSLQREQDVPYPYLWVPVEDAVPAFDYALSIAWEKVWCRVPGFQVMKFAFPGTAPASEISAVTRNVFMALHNGNACSGIGREGGRKRSRRTRKHASAGQRKRVGQRDGS